MSKPEKMAVIDLPSDILNFLEKRLSQQKAFDAAVQKHLGELVRELSRLRLTKPEDSHRRPRKITSKTWEELGKAAAKLDMSRQVLLRACLRHLIAEMEMRKC